MKRTLSICLLSILLSNYSIGRTFFKPVIYQFKKDSTAQQLKPGFALTLSAGINYGITKGNYSYESLSTYTDSSSIFYSYPLKSQVGYRIGLGLEYRTKSFDFELPITYSVERFKVPSLNSDPIKVAFIEFGINNYFKFSNEQNAVLLGPFITLNSGIGKPSVSNMGLNIGYGRNFLKKNKLHIGIRYHFNSLSLKRKNDNVLEISKSSSSDKISSRNCYSNSIQVIFRFDIVHTHN